MNLKIHIWNITASCVQTGRSSKWRSNFSRLVLAPDLQTAIRLFLEDAKDKEGIVIHDTSHRGGLTSEGILFDKSEMIRHLGLINVGLGVLPDGNLTCLKCGADLGQQTLAPE